jgi:thiamine biosynthesis lipoprotein
VVLAEFEACDAAMSRFRGSSEITELNRSAFDGAPRSISRRLRQALVACDRAHRMTDGRFDPRVLKDLERLGDRGAPIAEGETATASAPRASERMVDFAASERAQVSRPIDLGGIGKGLALRWATAGIRRMGVSSFLLEAGGDLVTAGRPPDSRSWRIGLEDPGGNDEPLAVIAAADVAVATSSTRRRRWQVEDRLVHHLIDPRTGEPGGAGLRAVTVAGPDPAWAEVWSKALFLDGAAGIAALARRRGLAAWWVLDDGSLEMTAAARIRTIWVRDEAGL